MEIASNPKITKVEIHHMFQAGIQGQAVPQDLGMILMAMQVNGKIKNLDLSNNFGLFAISPKAAEEGKGAGGYVQQLIGENHLLSQMFIKTLKANPKLEQLNLSGVNLSDAAMSTVIRGIETLSITSLDVSLNSNITRSGL